MAKFFIEVEVDESFIKDNDKSAGQYLSEEMGWVDQSGIRVNDYVRIDDAKEIHLSDVVNEEYVVSEPDFAEPHDYTQAFVKMLDECVLSLHKEDNGYALINQYDKNIMEEDFLFDSADHIIEICDEHGYLNDMFDRLVDDVENDEVLCQETADISSAFPYVTTAEWCVFMENHSDFKDAHSDEYAICRMMDDTNKTVDLDSVVAEFDSRSDAERKTKNTQEIDER